MVIGTMNPSIRNGQTEHIKPLPRCAKPSQRQSSQHSRSLWRLCLGITEGNASSYR